MSTEDRDRTIGRLLREHRESAQRLALLRTKIMQSASDLASAAESLRAIFDPNRTEPAAAARREIGALPSQDALLAIVEEYRLERERFDRLEPEKIELC